MSVKSRFLIVRNTDEINLKYFDYNSIKGYCLTAKEVVHFKDAIEISRMVVINPAFKSLIAMKKLESKFEKLISFIELICREEDDDSDESYQLALDEAERFKKILETKYRTLITQEKYELMKKKISILENELKLRIKYFEYYKKEEQKGKSK